MKRIFLATAMVLLTGSGLASAAQAAPLTRSVQVTEDDGVHLYLGTQFGQTLYTFDIDANGQSACVQTCAEKWPPLLVNAADAAALVAPFATITRGSGLLQVTYQGKPIYTFFLDHAEGDDKGDGVGGVWHDIDFQP